MLVDIHMIFFLSILISAECFEETRLLHLKLLLQEGPKYSAADSLSHQCTWNDEFNNEHLTFKSFLTTIVGRDMATRRKTLQIIFDKCDEWETTQSWKYLLFLLRIVLDVNDFNAYGQDERNEFKTVTKSMVYFYLTKILRFSLFYSLILFFLFLFGLEFLKDTFRSSIDEEDEVGLYVLFLVARQITQYNETLLGNYTMWYVIAI